MMSLYVESPLLDSFNTETDKKDRFQKAVVQSAKDFRNHYLTFYSKVSNGLTTAIGTMLRGVGKRTKNEAGFLALKDSTAMAIMAFDQPLISLKTVRETLSSLALLSPFQTPVATAGGSLPPENKDIIETSPLGETFKASLEYGSEELAAEVEQYITEEIQTTQTTAQLIAKNEFIGPLREEVQSLRNNFNLKKVSEKTFLEDTSKTLLEYNGIVFSEAFNHHAIFENKLNDMRSDFSEHRKRDGGSNPILVFRNFSEGGGTFAPPEQQREPVATNKPALIPIRT